MIRHVKKILVSAGMCVLALSLSACLSITPSSPNPQPSWAEEALAITAEQNPPADVPLIELSAAEKREIRASQERVIATGEEVRDAAERLRQSDQGEMSADEFLAQKREQGTPPPAPN